MGDRIAILEVGGHLAQYATPSELLLHPANEFVEDFVGADRALKRLALMRVRDVPREALGSANGGPEIALDMPLRDALSDLLAARRRCTAAWSTRRAARSGRSASRRSPTSPPGRTPVILAQLEIRERGGEPSCVERNGFCPDWIADNWERYRTPLVEHIELTLISVAIGFAIAFALALIAHRRRWLIPPITQITGILYTLPSVALFFLLLPLTGRGKTTAVIALVAYSLLIIFRNVITGLEGVPGRGARRRPRHGPHAAPAAVARRAAARAAGDHGRAADRGHDDRRADRARVPGRRRRARRGDLRRHAVPLQRRRRRRAVRAARGRARPARAGGPEGAHAVDAGRRRHDARPSPPWASSATRSASSSASARTSAACRSAAATTCRCCGST